MEVSAKRENKIDCERRCNARQVLERMRRVDQGATRVCGGIVNYIT